MLATAHAKASPPVKITGIEITHHRLPLDPPFNASWDTQPRRHFDATIVRVHTDAGHHRHRLGRHDARLRGPRAPVHRPGPAGDRAALAGAQQHPVPLGPLLAARPRAVGPRGQDHRPAGVAAARRPLGPGQGLCVFRHPARSRGAGRAGRALPRRGLSGPEDPLPPRQLARRHQGARSRAGARRRQARPDGRLQPGLAHVVGCLPILDPEGCGAGRPRAGAPGRLLDGGAAAPRRPRRHAAPEG